MAAGMEVAALLPGIWAASGADFSQDLPTPGLVLSCTVEQTEPTPAGRQTAVYCSAHPTDHGSPTWITPQGLWAVSALLRESSPRAFLPELQCLAAACSCGDNLH